MTDEPEYKVRKILARAPRLDDLQNRLAAFVGASSKTGVVQILFYMDEDMFDELGKPGYVTVSAENGANLNDF